MFAVPGDPALLSVVEAAPPDALYLHVPFCPSICPYCDFHKMKRHEGLVAAYLDRFDRESAELAARYPLRMRTVYLGGGTPSMLQDAELERVAAVLERDWSLSGAVEVTLEADPLTYDAERLRFFRQLGFTRLSIGLQSLSDDTLKFLGRQHDAAAGREAVELALEAGFRVSADIITAVPGQDAAFDLRSLAETGVSHVSVYSLTVEPFTPFALRGVEVDEDQAAADFTLATELLAEHGLERYEVSNHARPGHESQHNSVYWSGAHYLALGPSAASFEPAEGLVGIRRTRPHIRSWLLGGPAEEQPVDAVEHTLESLMTALRTRGGLDLDALLRRGGADPRVVFPGPLAELTAHGFLELHGSKLTATAEGLPRLNAVLRRFFAEREAAQQLHAQSA